MKKNFILALVCSVMAINAVNAQTENVYYGSKQGGFAIRVSADQVFNFVGNMFNGTTGNSLEYWNTIGGKYFVTDNVVLKGGINVENTNSTYYLYDDQDDAELLTGEYGLNSKNMKFYVGGKYLLRPGKRLQPSVGATILYQAINNGLTNNNDMENETISKISSPERKFGFNATVNVEYFLSKSFSIDAELILQAVNKNTKDVSEFESSDSQYNEDYITMNNYSRKYYKATGLYTFSELSFNFYF